MEEQIKLINLAQNGDSKAVNQLLEDYQYIVRILARKYFLIGGDREDLHQEGMIGLYKAITSYDATKNAAFSTYASVCVNSQMKNAVKKSTRLKNQVLNTALSLQDVVYLEKLARVNPEDTLIEKHNYAERVEKINARLSALEKKVLVQYLQGLSYAEIAKNLNKNPKSIDNAIARIKIKLKNETR